MARTLLVLGPARAGKSTLIQALAAEHTNHHWHFVRLEPSRQGSSAERMDSQAHESGSRWRIQYGRRDVLAALPGLIQQIQAGLAAPASVIAFEAAPDPLLRHAYPYDLRAFVLSPMQDETILFRRPDEARTALRQILQDSSAFASQTRELGPTDASEAPAPFEWPPPAGGGEIEVNQSQVAAFLAEPLGAELAVQVHLQPPFGAIADADIVILNTTAGSPCCQGDPCWRRLLGLLERLRKAGGRAPLACTCDLADPADPGFVRIRQRMSDVLCRE
jgi:hypothetical protein